MAQLQALHSDILEFKAFAAKEFEELQSKAARLNMRIEEIDGQIQIVEENFAEIQTALEQTGENLYGFFSTV